MGFRIECSVCHLDWVQRENMLDGKMVWMPDCRHKGKALGVCDCGHSMPLPGTHTCESVLLVRRGTADE